MASVMSDNLAEHFPEARDEIERIHGSDPDSPALNAYTYLAEVVWAGSFEPALASGDEPAIRHCFRVAEDLLASDDQNIRTAASIRVTEHLSGGAARRIVAKYGGLNLRRDLARTNDRPMTTTHRAEPIQDVRHGVRADTSHRAFTTVGSAEDPGVRQAPSHPR